MDKKSVKTALTVVLGICALIMLYSFALLISDAALADDLKGFATSSQYETIYFVKWSATGLVCLLVPTFASAAFAYFGKNKFLPLIAAVMLIFTAASAIGLSAAVKALSAESSAAFAAATAYMQELLQLAVAAILAGTYFIVTAVKALKPVKEQKVIEEEAEDEENV